MPDRVARQLAFLAECDRLKSVDRANLLIDKTRPENSAEHSWHLALWALIFAPIAPAEVDIDRVIAMLLLHDVVEIDAGDMPIHLAPEDPEDVAAHAAAEARAAHRLFGILPPDQAQAFAALWQEFEAAITPDARFAKRLDHTQPAFQTLLATPPVPDHAAIVADNFASGRAARLREEWPEIHATVDALLRGAPLADDDLGRRLRMLCHADRLKSVLRQTTLLDGSRRENSGEHSWHVALFALVLAEHACPGADPAKAVRMLLLHDLVEIEAGDTPLHDPTARAATYDAELRAAQDLFGSLPSAQGDALLGLWQAFEARACPTSRYAKAMDRTQPPQSNLATDGENWRRFEVTWAQIDSRVGAPIRDGAPAVWEVLGADIASWFAAQGAALTT